MAMGDRYNYYPPGAPDDPPPGYEGGWNQPPPPPQEPPPRGMQPPKPPRKGEMIRPRVAGLIVLIGVILFFVGTIIVQTATLLEPPDWDDYEEDSEDYDKDREEYEDSVRNLLGNGKIFNWIGAMIIVLPLYVIGVSSERLDWKVRASMLSAASAIIIAVMIVTMFLTTAPF